MFYLICVLLFLGGYFLGSIPFGLLLTRWAGLGDVRAIGSGNIGATNVLRTGNKKIAILTLFLDGFKGTLAVILANCVGYYYLRSLLSSNDLLIADLGFIAFPSFEMSAAIGALLGHMFPVWLGFKGGKGVATYLGILIAVAWQAALVFGIVWLLTAVITRYSSLAALIAVIIVPIFACFFGLDQLTILVLSLMGILIIIKHHANISRLLNGTESKIGKKKTQ